MSDETRIKAQIAQIETEIAGRNAIEHELGNRLKESVTILNELYDELFKLKKQLKKGEK